MHDKLSKNALICTIESIFLLFLKIKYENWLFSRRFGKIIYFYQDYTA